jgi:hypothetical protein
MLDHAKIWRSKAKELRASADECQTAEAREALLGLAKSHELMADGADARARQQLHDAATGTGEFAPREAQKPPRGSSP